MYRIIELRIPVFRQAIGEISAQNGTAAAGKAVGIVSLRHLHADSLLSIPGKLQGIDDCADLLYDLPRSKRAVFGMDAL